MDNIYRKYKLYKNGLWKPKDSNYVKTLNFITELYNLKMVIEDNYNYFKIFKFYKENDLKIRIKLDYLDKMYIEYDKLSSLSYIECSYRTQLILYFINKIHKII